LGPTGAGKTVLLEAIAGIAPVRKGTVIVDGEEISRLPPERRGIGLVYQDYALFPHLTVEQNIRFGLRYEKRIGHDESEKRFKKLIAQLNLKDLLHRKPGTLSGGELQRTALARAMIIRPKILLLDEPLSAIDQTFREEIRRELQELHESTDTVFLMVTHDFRDAISLGTKAAVLHRGQIEQTGDILEIYRRPANRFVADFVGMGNILEARFSSDKTTAYAQGLEVLLPAGTALSGGTEYRYIAIRPEEIVLSTHPLDSSMRNHFRGTVTSIRDFGIAYEVRCAVVDGTAGDCTAYKTELVSHVTRGAILELKLEVGREVYLSWKATATHLL
jgi:molybdate/tungstate transport system ATP-binding protein